MKTTKKKRPAATTKTTTERGPVSVSASASVRADDADDRASLRIFLSGRKVQVEIARGDSFSSVEIPAWDFCEAAQAIRGAHLAVTS